MTPNFFIGFPVGAPVLVHRLPPPPPRVRIFEVADLHLTVAFLGRVEVEDAARAFDVCSGLGLQSFRLRFGTTRLLGHPRRPSAMAWVPLEGAEAAEREMARGRGPALAAASLPEEERPPLAHVTFARLARKATGAQRMRAKAYLQSLRSPDVEIIIRELSLFTWAENRNERLFRRLHTVPLRTTMGEEVEA